MRKLLYCIIILLVTTACSSEAEQQAKQSTPLPQAEFVFKSKAELGKAKLSDYGFFQPPLADLKPQRGVHPYRLNSPLFSDYAHKARFVMIPEGKSARYQPTEVMEFPVGTILIKNFYYPADFSKPEAERRIIETRLLIHEEQGWNALPYVWNDEQTDAFLEIAGATKSVSWRDEEGHLKQINYSVPNKNQCRSCHLKDGEIMPIGPTARQLNGQLAYSHGQQNQLAYWQEQQLLQHVPKGALPALADYRDKQHSLEDRARAYLEINCGHCHRPEGPAKNSALHLMASVENPASLGVGKTPIAAGKGSGGLQFDIVKGKPDQSILAYRMASLDPGIMMPELGRKLVHEEGLELIREWIAEME